jgi:hypothetical protein
MSVNHPIDADATRFSDQLSRSLVEFCWDEWAQIGVLARPRRISPWAVDPEALIVFTLEVARADPRLFDEVLDWMLLNEGLLSIRRLRAMCSSTTDRTLVNAAIGWLDWQRPRARLKTQPARPSEKLVPLFHGGGPVMEADPSFAAAGLLRPPLAPSRKSRAPDLAAPITIDIRLRAILGVGIRAEVIRVMLGSGAPWMTAQTLAQTSQYAKRNVHEALTSLADAQVIDSFTVGGEQRYSLNRDIWAALLQRSPDALPGHRDWPQLFSALRSILRWSELTTNAGDSEYLLASSARQLLVRLSPELSFVGIPSRRSATVDDAGRELERVTASLLGILDVNPAPTPPS